MKRGAKIVVFGVAAVLILSSCTEAGSTSGAEATPTSADIPRSAHMASAGTVTVYASPTCGCCHEYIPYLEEHGLEVKTETITDVESVKAEAGIPEAAWSCHTAVIGDYYVEGHVPVEAIAKLLEEQPKIDGIALPGMPAGSPGMSGEKTGPFEVVAITGEDIEPFMSI